MNQTITERISETIARTFPGRVLAAASELDFAEYDPHGTDAHAPGAKLDAGKNQLGLIFHGFPRALQAVGEVGTYGAQKYSPNGWLHVPDGERRYTDAMYRHLMKEAQGERIDPVLALEGFEILHAAQSAWNALARLELMLRNEEKI